MSDNNSIIIEPINEATSFVQWTPNVGPETEEFLERVVPNNSSRDSVRKDAVSILAKCIAPSNTGQQTGLVVGYVQSGKTMSIETVATLARENCFQIVIVISGTSVLLLNQAVKRLSRDLMFEDSSVPRRWIHFNNPSRKDKGSLEGIRDILADWREENLPAEYKNTVLITVLKHHTHLQNLVELINELEMLNIPVLIIDDEADQASLNTRVRYDKESTTYRQLMELRQKLPCHSYLQYTATPQAPLLLSIIDSLSPNFVQVIDPGSEYVGGQEFFGDDDNLVCVIPEKDVPNTQSSSMEPPKSLLSALRVFMLGVAAGLIDSEGSGNRSMLVHPSHGTNLHSAFYNWISAIFQQWKRLLSLAPSDPDRKELVESFHEAYDSLTITVGANLPKFDKLASILLAAFRKTTFLEVNTRDGPTPQVNWHQKYGWILVGGQSMDRGFTVEGLTVTYMPRGIGVGHADTIQQRARFFGYKKAYLGYCRVYLEDGTFHAFRNYVNHEEYMRRELKKIQHKNQNLNEWKRSFVLDSDLKLCRKSVLEFEYVHLKFTDSWIFPSIVFDSESIIKANLETVESFMNELTFKFVNSNSDQPDDQRHKACYGVSLRSAVEQLLVGIRYTSLSDSQRNTAMLLYLSYLQENNPDEHCTVFQMSPNENRIRSIDQNGKVKQLFQGKDPKGSHIYPGDRAIRSENTVSIQIHKLNLKSDNNDEMKNVPVIAVWLPKSSDSFIVQDQSGLND